MTRPQERLVTQLAGLPANPETWERHHHATWTAAHRWACEESARIGRRIAAGASVKARTTQPAPKRQKRTRKSAELVASEAVVRRRSGGDCEARTPWCEGRATQAHHRIGRTDHRPEMLLDVCGQGNATGCHGYIHQHPAESYAEGWMVKRLGMAS